MNVNETITTVAVCLAAALVFTAAYITGMEAGEIKVQKQATQLGHAVFVSTGPRSNTFYWLNPQKDRIQQAMEMYEANK